MSDEVTIADRALLGELRRVVDAVDPAPDFLHEMGRAVFSTRRVDAELAELVSDSNVERQLVRSVAVGQRLLTFRHGELTLEVEVSGAGAERRVLGVVEADEPTGDGRVDVEAASGVVGRAALDAAGRFDVRVSGERVVRFRVAIPGVLDVTTEWITLAD